MFIFIIIIKTNFSANNYTTNNGLAKPDNNGCVIIC